MDLATTNPASHARPTLRKLCSPVTVQRRLLQLRFQAAGLRKEIAVLGSGQISYWTGGDGPPLLLIPGFGATAIWQWHAQVGALQKHYRLVVPDLLFFGDSRSSRSNAPWTHKPSQWELLDHLMIERCIWDFHTVGSSPMPWPASIQRIQKLLLNNSPGPVMRQPGLRYVEEFQVARVHELFLPARYGGIRPVDVGWHRAPKSPTGF